MNDNKDMTEDEFMDTVLPAAREFVLGKDPALELFEKEFLEPIRQSFIHERKNRWPMMTQILFAIWSYREYKNANNDNSERKDFMKTGFPEEDLDKVVWRFNDLGGKLPGLYENRMLEIGARLKQFEGILKASMEKAGVAS